MLKDLGDCAAGRTLLHPDRPEWNRPCPDAAVEVIADVDSEECFAMCETHVKIATDEMGVDVCSAGRFIVNPDDPQFATPCTSDATEELHLMGQEQMHRLCPHHMHLIVEVLAGVYGFGHGPVSMN